jgi:YVTN family beta-propeller protein
MKRLVLPLLALLPVLLGLGLVFAWLTFSAPVAAQPAQPDKILFWSEDFLTDPSPPQYYVSGTVGSAVVVSDSFMLTQDAMSQYGRIFYLTPTVMSGFSAEFEIYLGNHNGADGLAFHFCPVYDYTPGAGGSLNAECPGGYFVAFDTYPSWNGEVYLAQGNVNNRLVQVSVNHLEDDAWHGVTISLEQESITVILDGVPVIDQFSIPSYTPFLGYFGFSAATGAEMNDQRVDTVRVYLTPGVYLSPNEQFGSTMPGNPITYTASLANSTGVTDTFSLAVEAAAWPTTLSIANTGPLPDQAFVTFTVQVQVPADAQPGDFDEAIIRADSDTTPVYSDTMTIRSIALSGQYGYVFNADDDRINVIDTQIHEMGFSIDTAPYGSWPWAGELSPDGEQLYVSLRDSDAVLVVDTASNTPIISIPVESEPFEIAFSPDGEHAFVANWDSDSVSVIDTAIQTVTAVIPVGDGPQGVASSPCLDKVYVIDRWDYDIYVLDTVDLTVTTVITGFTAQLFDIVISPYGHRAYVTNQWDGSIYVIDTLNDTWIDTWYVGALSQNGLDISPDGRVLYMTSNSDGIVYALDAFTGRILHMSIIGPGNWLRSGWDIETFPAGMGNFAYASLPGLGQVSVLDTTTYEQIETIETGGGPRGMALFPPEAACLSGVLLDPPQAVKSEMMVDSVVFTQTLYNLTGVADSFALSADAVWTTTLSLADTGLVPASGWMTFTVEVEIPPDAQVADYDIANLTAVSDSDPGINAQAQLKTAVPRPGYVFNADANLINVVDTAAHVDTGYSFDTTPYGDFPFVGELSPNGEKLYVSLRDSNAVLVGDTTRSSPVITIPVGVKPFEIAFSPDGAYAFVANRDSNSVSVIDTAVQTVTAVIPVGSGPQGVASSPCLDKMYVVDRGDYDIYVLDTVDLTVTTVITGFTNELFDIAISPLGDRAYATNQWDYKVYVIDTATDTWIDTFDVPVADLNNSSIESIDISPNGKVLYITSNADGRTYVLDAYTGEALGEFGTGPSDWEQGSWQIEVFPWWAGSYAYVTSPLFWDDPLGDVKVLNLETGQVVGSIYLGGGPRGMALFPPASTCGAPPSATFSPEASTIQVGESISFTSDVSGFPAPDLTWDFGDGSPTSSEDNPIHAFLTEGVFNVSLLAENIFGQASATGVVTTYLPVSADFSPLDGLAVVGTPFTFTNLTVGTGPLTYTWDFGDGSFTSSEIDPVHTYTSTGVYTVTLLAEGPYGEDSAMGLVTVYEPVTADFSPLDATVMVREAITFTNLSTGTLPLTYTWDFGDGSPTSAEVNPIHTYFTAGDYIVTLTVTGPYGTDHVQGIIHVTGTYIYLPFLPRDTTP